MGTDPVAEIDVLDDLARADVNYYQLSSIRTRIADARISVDWNVSELSIERSGHLVTSNASLRDRCDLLACPRIDNAERGLTLVDG
jgi:hypothetical protein